MKKYRCVDCGQYHTGKCDPLIRLVFKLDCLFDRLDDLAGADPEPASRRAMILAGEYPAGKYPTPFFARKGKK